MDGIKSLTGTKNTSIDWSMEKIMRHPSQSFMGPSTIKNMIQEDAELNYWNGSRSEFENTIAIDQSGVLKAKKGGKLWSDQFGIYWKGISHTYLRDSFMVNSLK